MTYVEPKGYHKEKLFYIGYWLGKHSKDFEALDIIGFEHCKEIVEMMRTEGKEILAFDVNFRKFRGLSENERVCLDADSKEAQLIFRLLPKERGAYVNLHGNIHLIETLAKTHKFVMAIATPRGPRGKFHSALEILRKKGAEVHRIGKCTWITILWREKNDS